MTAFYTLIFAVCLGSVLAFLEGLGEGIVPFDASDPTDDVFVVGFIVTFVNLLVKVI